MNQHDLRNDITQKIIAALESDKLPYRIGPFDNQDDAEQAAKNANAEGEYDINNQQVYLLGPDHRTVALSEEDVGGDGEYDDELFEGLDPFEGSEGI